MINAAKMWFSELKLLNFFIYCAKRLAQRVNGFALVLVTLCSVSMYSEVNVGLWRSLKSISEMLSI